MKLKAGSSRLNNLRSWRQIYSTKKVVSIKTYQTSKWCKTGKILKNQKMILAIQFQMKRLPN